MAVLAAPPDLACDACPPTTPQEMPVSNAPSTASHALMVRVARSASQGIETRVLLVWLVETSASDALLPSAWSVLLVITLRDRTARVVLPTVMNAQVQAVPPVPMVTDSTLQANVWNVPLDVAAALEKTSRCAWVAVRVSS